MDNIEEESQNFAYAVKNPMTFIAAATWSTQDTNVNYMWFDKNIERYSDGKSIFDPSPIGWKLPIYGVYSDFPANCTGIVDKVCTYTPASAVLPATGYRNRSTSTRTSVGSNLTYWLSTPNSSTSAYRLYATSSSASNSNNPFASGNVLRAIRE